MSSLTQQMKDRRIWRVLIAYPSMTFVLLQVIEFFINNYQLDPRFLTGALIMSVVLLPAAFLWNWRHGEEGNQAFSRGEILAYLGSSVAALLAVSVYWQQTPSRSETSATGLTDHNGPAVTAVDSIAVLPLTNSSGEASAQYLSDGIAESLINWLTEIPNLRVSSKSAAFRHRDDTESSDRIAKTLKVDSLLRGALERVGDQMVVSVAWVDARDDSQIWGARLTQPDNDILALEKDIVQAIKAGLTEKGIVKPVRETLIGGTSNTTAHAHYLRGHFLIQSTDTDNIYQGIDELRLAIAADPTFARPYADLADALSQLVSYGHVTDAGLKGEARNAAFTAVALAPDLPEAHTAMALVNETVTFDWQAVDQAYANAISLDPASPAPYHRYADYLVLTLRLEKSAEMAAKALALDPLDSSSMHAAGISAWARGDFEEARAHLEEWVRFYPQSIWAKVKLALILSIAGYCDEAQQAIAVFDDQRRAEMSNLMASWLAWGMHNCGDDNGFAIMKAHIESRASQSNNLTDPGQIYLAAIEGDEDRVAELLAEVVENRDPFIAYYQVFSLRHLGLGISGKMDNHPQYQALLDSLNFPPHPPIPPGP